MRGGRHASNSLKGESVANVDIYNSKVLWALGPTKLFRSQYVRDYNFRFFEQGMPEDLHFVLPALVEAQTVSLASDYDYYHVCWRNKEGQNTTSYLWSRFAENMISYEKLLSYIDAHISEADRNKVLMKRLFTHDVIKLLQDILNVPILTKKQRLRKITELFGPYYTFKCSAKACQNAPEKYRVLELAFKGKFWSLLWTLKKATAENKLGD